MIEFKFNCPGCGQHIQANDAYSGRQINCPTCQSILVVPQAPGAPPPRAASPPPLPPSRAQAAPAMQSSAPAMQRAVPPAKKSTPKWILIAAGSASFVVCAVVSFLLVSHFQSRSDSDSAGAASSTKLTAGKDSADSASANLEGPSASEIVDKVTEKYQSLTSFSATGSAITDLDMSKVDVNKLPGMDKVPVGKRKNQDFQGQMPKKVKMESDFTVKLGRPDLYRVEWSNQSSQAQAKMDMKGAVWSAGDGDFIAMSKNKYTKMDNRDIALASATGISGGVAGSMPAIFFNDASSQMSFFKTGKRIKDQTLDGEDCYVLNGTAMGMKIVLWVAKDSYLIKQKQMVFGGKSNAPEVSDAQMEEGMAKLGHMTDDQKKQAKAMAKQMKPMLSQMKGTMTETYSNIEINKSLGKSEFKHDLPPGAVLSKTLF